MPSSSSPITPVTSRSYLPDNTHIQPHPYPAASEPSGSQTLYNRQTIHWHLTKTFAQSVVACVNVVASCETNAPVSSSHEISFLLPVSPTKVFFLLLSVTPYPLSKFALPSGRHLDPRPSSLVVSVQTIQQHCGPTRIHSAVGTCKIFHSIDSSCKPSDNTVGSSW
jgi:hypothetical protein